MKEQFETTTLELKNGKTVTIELEISFDIKPEGLILHHWSYDSEGLCDNEEEKLLDDEELEELEDLVDSFVDSEDWR